MSGYVLKIFAWKFGQILHSRSRKKLKSVRDTSSDTFLMQVQELEHLFSLITSPPFFVLNPLSALAGAVDQVNQSLFGLRLYNLVCTLTYVAASGESYIIKINYILLKFYRIGLAMDQSNVILLLHFYSTIVIALVFHAVKNISFTAMKPKYIYLKTPPGLHCVYLNFRIIIYNYSYSFFLCRTH